MSTNLVQQVTELMMGERFAADNGLTELFDGGVAYARERPDFPIHAGAETAFDPSLEPLVDPDFVQATEGLRSFLVSMIIAVFLFFRWLRRRATLAKEHKLDRYIKALLDIERRQALLDEGGNVAPTDLRQLLGEVTHLRQQALGDFTAHELNEERAAQTFIEMCHALSDKLNARILEQRLEAQASASG